MQGSGREKSRIIVWQRRSCHTSSHDQLGDSWALGRLTGSAPDWSPQWILSQTRGCPGPRWCQLLPAQTLCHLHSCYCRQKTCTGTRSSLLPPHVSSGTRPSPWSPQVSSRRIQWGGLHLEMDLMTHLTSPGPRSCSKTEAPLSRGAWSSEKAGVIFHSHWGCSEE